MDEVIQTEPKANPEKKMLMPKANPEKKVLMPKAMIEVEDPAEYNKKKKEEKSWFRRCYDDCCDRCVYECDDWWCWCDILCKLLCSPCRRRRSHRCCCLCECCDGECCSDGCCSGGCCSDGCCADGCCPEGCCDDDDGGCCSDDCACDCDCSDD